MKLYSPIGDELIGVYCDNKLVMLTNASPDPTCSFDISADDIMEWMDKSQATWHTHPNAPANLSGEDYQTFMQWPDHYHFIAGNDGVKCYKYDAGKDALLEVGEDD